MKKIDFVKFNKKRESAKDDMIEGIVLRLRFFYNHSKHHHGIPQNHKVRNIPISRNANSFPQGIHLSNVVWYVSQSPSKGCYATSSKIKETPSHLPPQSQVVCYTYNIKFNKFYFLWFYHKLFVSIGIYGCPCCSPSTKNKGGRKEEFFVSLTTRPYYFTLSCF